MMTDTLVVGKPRDKDVLLGVDVAADHRPVRVCFMIDDLAAAGTESQLVALIQHLDCSRVRPFLCLLRGEGEGSWALEPADCPILRLGLRSLRHPRNVARMWQLVRFLRQHEIDVFQAYFPESTYLGVPAARLAGVPFILRTRNNLGYWMTPLHRFLGRLCCRFVHATIANCEAGRQAVIRDEGLDPGTVHVLENGVDVSRFRQFSPYTAHQGPMRVGVVANLRAVKSLDVFVRAAAEVVRSRADVTFQIAGEGDERPALQRLIDELGLRGRFLLCGSVRDMPAFLAGLDVAVLCSRSEGMSNAVLEYMAAGRAIIATNVGANGELIQDGVHGMLVPPGDVTALARAINSLLRDPERAERLAGAARRRAWERYSRESMVERFQEFYERLTAGSRVARNGGIK